MENETFSSECVRCGTPLQSYIRLLNYPASLFNQGLAKARAGAFRQARDLFAAVVYWCPKDVEARNALAMTCLALQDLLEARRQWKLVLDQVPTDAIALRGLKQLDEATLPAQEPEHPPAKTNTTAMSQTNGKGKKLFKLPQKKQKRR